MNISLPEAMRKFVEEEVASGSYGSASEYFRDLLRERQRARAQDELETKLLSRLKSGKYKDFTPETFKNHMGQKLNELRSRKRK